MNNDPGCKIVKIFDAVVSNADQNPASELVLY